jgi:hypothetical protein
MFYFCEKIKIYHEKEVIRWKMEAGTVNEEQK